MESVLVGVDKSESSRRALRFALQRAKAMEWTVCVVHVVNRFRHAPGPAPDEARPPTRKAERKRAKSQVLEPLLAWAEEEGYLEGVEVSTMVRHGRPSELLSELAEKEGYDVIIVGRTGESDLKTAIFGSTANRLVQHAPVPVAVIP